MTVIIRGENEVQVRLDQDFASEYTQDLKNELNILINIQFWFLMLEKVLWIGVLPRTLIG